MSVNTPAAKALLRRYKSNYGIPQDVPLTLEQVMRHWDLERKLTAELLTSVSANRRSVFESCYTRLYQQLDWLNAYTGKTEPAELNRWLEALGSEKLTVYEVGSGRCELISFLSAAGHECTGSEITGERGSLFLSDYPVEIKATDGVHLGDFEKQGSYDRVLSNQVIEHLHPDDLGDHLAGAFAILTENGKYLLSTPHRFTGPHDLSRVFGKQVPEGMHLKEYTFSEIKDAARLAGFTDIRVAGASTGRSLQKLLRIEKRMGSIKSYTLKKLLGKILAKSHFFSQDIFLELGKTSR